MALVKYKVKTFAELVKFEHTVFALPFAYLGAILARKALPSWEEIILITMAMAGARSGAMGMNRIIDRKIDTANPRTKERHLPMGLIRVGEVFIFVIISFSLFTGAVYCLSPVHLRYVPLILFLLVGYSYTKRFTALSHLVLGTAIGFAPLGGWIAVSGKLDYPALLLGVVVALWIAGFDIIYAAKDMAFDKEYGLYSLPASVGLKRAFLIARILHALVLVLLYYLAILLNLGRWYLCGVFVTGIFMLYEHSLVSPGDLSRVDLAFFNINGIISSELFIFTILDVFLQ